MSNGQGLPRTTRYARLSAEEHLAALDNDLDANDYNRELIVKHISQKLTWVLTTFVTLIVLLCGTLLTVALR